MVAVVSNGTAVLGLGNLGALASKPVMEGKVALFKRFADVDGIDLCIDTEDVDAVDRLRALSRPQLRRHQPRGHQGAGVLHHRAAAARADGHAGVPRRPARHRDRRRRRADQRLPSHRTRAEIHAPRRQRRRRRRDRLRRAAQGDGHAARQRHPLRHQGRRLPGPHRGHEPVEERARGGHARAHAGRGDRGRRRVLRPLRQGRADRRTWCAAWPSGRSSSPWPTPIPRSRRRRRAPPARAPSSPPAAATIPTRSTTCSASPTSSAARWTCARAPSTRR